MNNEEISQLNDYDRLQAVVDNCEFNNYDDLATMRQLTTAEYAHHFHSNRERYLEQALNCQRPFGYSVKTLPNLF